MNRGVQGRELLQRVRLTGDWEAWLGFFLAGVADTAEQATRTTQSMLGLFARERAAIEAMGRASGNTLRLHYWIQRKPVFTIGNAASALDLSNQTVISALSRLGAAGIVRELTGKRRNRVFLYHTLLEALRTDV
jgi:Fic family protein